MAIEFRCSQCGRLWHWAALGLLAAGGLAVLWWFDPRQTVLPMCGLHTLTGWHCPGCGAVRATHELLHGRFLAALRFNALYVAALPLACYVAASSVRLATAGKPLPGDLSRRTWFWVSVGIAAAAFFILRNLPWYPFLLLAPEG